MLSGMWFLVGIDEEKRDPRLVNGVFGSSSKGCASPERLLILSSR